MRSSSSSGVCGAGRSPAASDPTGVHEPVPGTRLGVFEITVEELAGVNQRTGQRFTSRLVLKFLTYFARDWYFVCNQDFGPFDHGGRGGNRSGRRVGGVNPGVPRGRGTDLAGFAQGPPGGGRPQKCGPRLRPIDALGVGHN